jgi:hypothetical protein
MSTIRDNAHKILDAALPGNTVITSNGATASKYAEMTGISQKTLTDNWAKGGIMTGCNGFTGWFGVKMGSRTYLGGFDLQGIVKNAGKPDAWVPSRPGNRPAYGDILRHASFHVDVCVGFDGDILLRAAGGQGGRGSGCDIIKRVRGTGPYDHNKLLGWIDIDVYFDTSATPSASDATMRWLYGWWKVWDGNNYYYFFGPGGIVQYTKSKPSNISGPPIRADNTGTYTYTPGQLVVNWKQVSGAEAACRETFNNAVPGCQQMNATSTLYSPLVASRKLS